MTWISRRTGAPRSRPTPCATPTSCSGSNARHVREVVALTPQAWPRTFTLKELVRLGTASGPRPADEPAAQWLARLSAERRPTDLLGASPLDDVDDPTSSYTTDHPTLAEDIDRLTDDLLVLLYGP